MTKNQHTYDDEFRWNAVDLYVNSSKSMTEIASDLGISTGTLRDWKRKVLGGSGGGFGAGGGGPAGADAEDLVEENRRLRREVEHLRHQRDILKKAAAILGEDPHASMR
jgi:transposase